jgi:hypothetical protein
MADFQLERVDVEALLALTGISLPCLSDPNSSGRSESGADVVYCGPDGPIGIQVTDYTVDEAAHTGRTGRARAEEKRRADEAVQTKGPVKGYGMVVPGNHRQGLISRFKEKLRNSMDAFTERWLLVVAQKGWGATGATFFAASQVDVAELNADLDAMLQTSQFDKAFILLKVERVLFEWNRAERWRMISL